MPFCAQCATENPEIARFRLACRRLGEPGRGRPQPQSASAPGIAEGADTAHAIEVGLCPP